MWLEVKRIGVAKPIACNEDIASEGVAEIEIVEGTPVSVDALKGYSHLIIVTRSSGYGIKTYVAKVISHRNGVIDVKMSLKDSVDVIHIQPYDALKDCVYSASAPQRLLQMPKNEALKVMLRAGESFHGELCVGVAIGVRMLYRASVELACEPRDKELKAVVAVKACVADGIQAAMGATNKRFRALEQIDGTATFTYRGKEVKIRLAESPRFHDAKEVLLAKEEDIIGEVTLLPSAESKL
jgi:hypothetical protein